MKKIKTKAKKCKNCKKEFNRGKLKSGRLEAITDYRKRKFCSQECFFIYNQGRNHFNWMGGLKHRPDGYVRNNMDKYIHREIMEKYLDRKLKNNEVVHHINENPSDNRIKNLRLTTNSNHRIYHVKSQKRDKQGRFKK